MVENLKQALKNAIPNDIIIAFNSVDEYLTGNSYSDMDIANVIDEINNFAEKVRNKLPAKLKFYLSDGGISRLSINLRDNQITLWITPNSSNEVKDKWEGIC